MSDPPRFSRFDDKAGYNGRSPSAAVLQSAFVAVMEGMEHWYHRQQQLVDGRNLALDDSHKVTKGIRVMNSKVFHGLHTTLNEHGQVSMQVRGGEVCIMLHFVDTDTHRVPGVASCVVHSRLISIWGTVTFRTYSHKLSPPLLSLGFSPHVYIPLPSPLVPEETGRSGKPERANRKVQGAREPVYFTRFSPYPGAFVV